MMDDDQDGDLHYTLSASPNFTIITTTTTTTTTTTIVIIITVVVIITIILIIILILILLIIIIIIIIIIITVVVIIINIIIIITITITTTITSNLSQQFNHYSPINDRGLCLPAAWIYLCCLPVNTFSQGLPEGGMIGISASPPHHSEVGGVAQHRESEVRIGREHPHAVEARDPRKHEGGSGTGPLGKHRAVPQEMRRGVEARGVEAAPARLRVGAIHGVADCLHSLLEWRPSLILKPVVVLRSKAPRMYEYTWVIKALREVARTPRA